MANEQKSMEEIVSEVEAGLEQTRIHFRELGAEDGFTVGGCMPLVEDRVYMDYFNHFPSKLPGTSGRTQQNSTFLREKAERAGKSLEEFQRDISTAISISGVDADALRKYIDRVLEEGLSEPATAEIYKRLIVPVYLELRKMGYKHNTLK